MRTEPCLINIALTAMLSILNRPTFKHDSFLPVSIALLSTIKQHKQAKIKIYEVANTL